MKTGGREYEHSLSSK